MLGWRSAQYVIFSCVLFPFGLDALPELFDCPSGLCSLPSPKFAETFMRGILFRQSVSIIPLLLIAKSLRTVNLELL